MATTRIITAQVFSDWDPTIPVAVIDSADEQNYRVSFRIDGWVNSEGRDTQPILPSFVEAQAIAEKYGDALSQIKAAASKEIAALVAGLPVKK